MERRQWFQADLNIPRDEYAELLMTWNPKTLDNNWKSPETDYNKLTDNNKKEGNFFLNVGPDGNGEILKASIEILRELGRMINEN